MQNRSIAHGIQSRINSATCSALFRIDVLAALLFAVPILLPLQIANANEAIRTWVSADGSYSFRATLSGTYGNIVDLRREDGITLRVPLELLSSGDRAAAGQNERYFEIDGIGRISSPDDYTWSLAKQTQVGEGQVSVYTCRNPELAGGMTLTLTPQVAKGDAVRTSHLKGHWNGMLEVAKSMGFKIKAATKPKLTGTIPDRVEYQLTVSNLDGNPILVRGVTLFAKNRTFLFQILEEDNSENLNQYHKISRSLTLLD